MSKTNNDLKSVAAGLDLECAAPAASKQEGGGQIPRPTRPGGPSEIAPSLLRGAGSRTVFPGGQCANFVDTVEGRGEASPPVKSALWRDHLTPAEAADLAAFERETAVILDRRRHLSRQMDLIRWRGRTRALKAFARSNR